VSVKEREGPKLLICGFAEKGGAASEEDAEGTGITTGALVGVVGVGASGDEDGDTGSDASEDGVLV
jgi:hypothetical protein